MFMKNWHDDTVTLSKECPWLDDSNDAMIVAQHLGIPFQAIDLSKEYKDRIVDYMFGEYQRGRTPNPDILCNREIKFDVFLEAALKLGADFVATGHYCRKGTIAKNGDTIYQLLAGKDPNKDQSYFLCQLTQYQLSRALFPIGDLLKPEVRDIAKKAGLATAEKKDSQGLCFVGKVHLPDFLQQRLEPKKGNVIEVPFDSSAFNNGHAADDLVKNTQPYALDPVLGEVVGEHNGAHYYTIGQRRGLNIGGYEKPLFVIGTDTEKNVIYTGSGEDHPGLYRKGLFIPLADEHWVRPDLQLAKGESKKFQARIRYRQPLEACTLHQREDGLYIIFDRPQRGVTPGQFAAWYDADELIGSGVIH
jgi:tRNA-specific 2-thiouridylase